MAQWTFGSSPYDVDPDEISNADFFQLLALHRVLPMARAG
jgi:hypothetical protein